MIRRCDNGHAPLRLESGQRCPACARRREQGRATPAQRGYGADHQRARASLAALLPAVCGGDMGAPYCGRWILPTDRWVAAHVVDGAPEYGYVHAHPACNERAKGGGASKAHGVPRAIPAPPTLAMSTGSDSAGSPC